MPDPILTSARDTLRRAVREMLSHHSLVRSHASPPPREGGDGVTVVELAT